MYNLLTSMMVFNVTNSYNNKDSIKLLAVLFFTVLPHGIFRRVNSNIIVLTFNYNHNP